MLYGACLLALAESKANSSGNIYRAMHKEKKIRLYHTNIRILGAAKNTGLCMAIQQLSTNKCFQGTDLQRQLLKVLTQ